MRCSEDMSLLDPLLQQSNNASLLSGQYRMLTHGRGMHKDREIFSDSEQPHIPLLYNYMKDIEMNKKNSSKNILQFGGKQFRVISETQAPEIDDVQLPKRSQREFVPDVMKDNAYWSKRMKNNDSARKSRVKRKVLEKYMEQKLLALQKENIALKMELETLKKRYGTVSVREKKLIFSEEMQTHQEKFETSQMFQAEDHPEINRYFSSVLKEEANDFVTENGKRRSDNVSPNDLGLSESTRSPISECNECRQDFDYPLDLSSSSEITSYAGCYSPKLPLKLRIKSAFPG